MAEAGLNSIPTDSVKTDSMDTASYAPKSGLGDVTLTKGIPAKGAYALGTPIGPTGYDPELLQNMQKLINEKEKQKNSFLEGLKDATAWWSGGVAGPAEALQNRAMEKDRQDAELFGMKAQLSQAKTSQQLLAQRRSGMLTTLNNLAGGEAGSAGSGGTGGAGPTSGGYNRDVLNRVNELYANGQYDAGDKLLDNHLQEISKINRTAALSKDFYGKTIEVDLGGGKIGYVSVNDVVNGTFKPTPKGQAELKAAKEDATPDAKPPVTGGGYHGVAADVNNPTGIKQNGGFKTYDTPQAGVADTQRLVGTYLSNQGPMANTKVTPENLIGTWITGDAAKGADPQYKMHVDLVKSELDKAGVKLNADGTIPNTPQANAAVTRAKIIGEAGQQNSAKFLPHVTIAPATNVAPAATNVAPAATAPAQVPVAKTLGAGESIVPAPTTTPTTAAAPTVPAVAPAAAPAAAPTTQAQLPAIPPAPPAPTTFAQPAAQINLNAPITAAMRNQPEIDKANAIEGGKQNLVNLGKEEEKLLERTDPNVMAARARDNDYLNVLINKWGGDKNVAGVLNDPGWGSAIATALQQGLSTPFGSLSMPAIVDVLQRTAPHANREEIEASKEIARVLGQRIFDVVKQSKGSSSDRDWVAFKQIAGTADNGWDALQKIQKYDQIAIDTDKKDRQLYNGTFNGSVFNYGKHSINPEREKLYEDHAKRTSEVSRSHFTPTVTPNRPTGVPPGAQYHPETKTWWWQENGKWKKQ